MPSQHRKHRGQESERLVAARLANRGFPYAMPAGAGRSGTDVTGTPGVAWEIKARRSLDLTAWLRQAAAHAVDGQHPVLVVRPDGMGPASVGQWAAVLTLDDLIALLRQAGYGNPPGLELPALDIDPYTDSED